ncbi:MAG: UvrD-helicase domain-containing protein [Acidimicrobiia bacterium]|nr:UvrD-helicase domain-containing protein [Acidimicrobiia bacterium]
MTGPLADAPVRDLVRDAHDLTLLVEAGAGTGKTTVLVERVLALVATGRVRLRRLAAITFTEAAASELRDRVREALERAVAGAGLPDAHPIDDAGRRRCEQALAELDDAAIGTLHGFAQRILAEHPLESGLPPAFEVAGEIEASIAFDERWAAFADRLLDDPALEATLLEAFTLGLRLDWLRALARRLHDHHDRLLDAPFGAHHPGGLRPVDPEPVLGPLRAALAHRVSCTDPDDKLALHLERLAGHARTLEAADDDLERLDLLARGPGLATRYGRSGNWPDVTLVRGLLAWAEEARAELLARRRAAVIGPLAAAVRADVLDAAEARRRAGVLGFHDLLVLARQLLREDPVARRRVAERFDCLLVDEMQDTDPIQVELAVLLATDDPGAGSRPWSAVPLEPGRLFFVGDPKQSIYRFRRADVTLYERVRAAGNGSRGPAGQLPFRPGDPRLGEPRVRDPDGGRRPIPPGRLRPARRPPPGSRRPDPARGRRRRSRRRASRHRPGPRRRGAGRPAPVRARRRVVRDRPRHRRDPTGPARRHRRAAADPDRPEHHRDSPRAGRRPGPRREPVARLRHGRGARPPRGAAGRRRPHRRGGSRRGPAGPGLRVHRRRPRRVPPRGRPLGPPEASPAALAPEHPVPRALGTLRALHEAHVWETVSETVGRVVRELRFFETALAHHRPRDHWRRLRFLQEQARAFVEAQGGGLRDFVGWVERQAAEGARVDETVVPEPDDDAVRILTVHGAKGLEFPIVLLAGLEAEDRDESPPALWSEEGRMEVRVGTKETSFATPGYDDLAAGESAQAAAERIRLLYVAATRARDHLVVFLHHRVAGRCHASRLWEVLEGSPHRRLAPGVPAGPPPAAVTAAPRPMDEEERAAWLTDRARRLARAGRPASIAATALPVHPVPAAGRAEERADERADRVGVEQADEGVDESVEDAETRPPWRRGRAGTSLGRAVHAVLQTVDLASGADLEETARAQARAEGIPDREGEVRALVAGVLGSPIVREAVAGGRFWREVPVAAPVGDVVLEGFVDLLVEGPDGLVVVDYKTDRLDTEAAVDAAADRYRLQIGAYALALEKALGRTVSRGVLVFARPGRAVERDVGDVRAAATDALAAATAASATP